MIRLVPSDAFPCKRRSTTGPASATSVIIYQYTSLRPVACGCKQKYQEDGDHTLSRSMLMRVSTKKPSSLTLFPEAHYGNA